MSMFGDRRPGEIVGKLTIPPLTRATLALYAGASGDHNPIHIDSDEAQAVGLPDVIGHGMLAMAYLGRVLTETVPQAGIRSFDSRFIAPIRIGDSLTCTAIFQGMKDDLALVQLAIVDDNGETKAVGEATVKG